MSEDSDPKDQTAPLPQDVPPQNLPPAPRHAVWTAELLDLIGRAAGDAARSMVQRHRPLLHLPTPAASAPEDALAGPAGENAGAGAAVAGCAPAESGVLCSSAPVSGPGAPSAPALCPGLEACPHLDAAGLPAVTSDPAPDPAPDPASDSAPALSALRPPQRLRGKVRALLSRARRRSPRF